MPVWGEVLTPEQLDALVQFTMEVSSGASVELGQRLYTQNCASCHGDFGEGGVNPNGAEAKVLGCSCGSKGALPVGVLGVFGLLMVRRRS